MTNAYTENNIVRFIYKECDLFERLEIEFALEDDSTLMTSYSHLREGFDLMPTVKFSPKKETLDAILQYSAGVSL
jgi:hypothetical protein